MGNARELGKGIALMAALAMSADAHAAIKCWTNKQGVRECGNTVPPEYAQKETRTVNQRGMTIDVQKRALTPEEIRARNAQEAQAGGVDAAAKSKEEQERNDRALLATFASEQDIVMARDRALEALRGMVDYNRATVGKLESRLADYKSRADKDTKAGKKASPELDNNIATLEQQIADKQVYMAAKEKEIEATELKYNQDLQRFRELTQQSR